MSGSIPGGQVVAGWYPDGERLRYWDGSAWGVFADEYRDSRTGKPVVASSKSESSGEAPVRRAQKIVQGGGVLRERRGGHVLSKVVAVVVALCLLGVGYSVLLVKNGGVTTTTATTTEWVPQQIDSQMGTLWGSTAGVLTISHELGGYIVVRCITGKKIRVGPGQSAGSPCVGAAH
jgi:hypothetical protein